MGLIFIICSLYYWHKLKKEVTTPCTEPCPDGMEPEPLARAEALAEGADAVSNLCLRALTKGVFLALAGGAVLVFAGVLRI